MCFASRKRALFLMSKLGKVMSKHNKKHNHPSDASQEVEVMEESEVMDETEGMEPEEVVEVDAEQEAAAEDRASEGEPSEGVGEDVEAGAEVDAEADAETTASEPEPEPSSKKSEVDWKDAYVRLAADFDNYRKRTVSEHDDIRKRERERVVNMWLDVYDNAERALAALPEKEGAWYEGFLSLIKQMDKCLSQLHIVPADDMGKVFDPKRHEAIATLPNPQMENNTIMHVERRGFVYENGDVARVARVVVVRNPS